MASLQITQRKGLAGARQSQRDTLRSLGLHGIGTTVERTDGPAVRGMIRVVAHLVDVSSAGKDKRASG
jgi:large subunit ribosomal protein L30